MPRWLKITTITLAVIFGLLLSTFFIVPWQIKKQGSKWIAENTARTLTIEKVAFNPFTLTIEINDTKLTEQNSEQPFVSFKRLLLSGSINSILQQAIILDRIELDDPFINIEMLAKQQFNFSDFTNLGSDTLHRQQLSQRGNCRFRSTILLSMVEILILPTKLLQQKLAIKFSS